MPRSILTTTSASVQTWSVPSDWNDTGSTVEGIGPGGNGSGRVSASVGGHGGGGGSYAKTSNVDLTPSGSASYFLPAGGSAVDAWFNDLNLVLQSQTFATSPWALTNASAPSAGVNAPDGTATALKLTEDTATAQHQSMQATVPKNAGVAANSVTYTLYVHNSSSRSLIIYLFDGSETNGYYWVFNPATQTTDAVNSYVFGTATLTSKTIGTDSIATGSGGNGWYRAQISITTGSSATLNVVLRLFSTAQSYAGDGSSGVVIWGAQLTHGSSAKPYVVTTTAAKYTLLCRYGTNATTAAVGVGQSGSLGDTTFQGGSGFTTVSSVGGGGGGAAGPSGAGTTATSSAGGAADNGTVAGGAQGANGNAGTEWTTAGAGSGAGGRSGTGAGFVGGNYGGGGSGTGTQNGATLGAGAPALIVINYTLGSPIADPVNVSQARVRAAFW